MTDQRPDAPTSGPDGTPASVPAHPVVQIEIFGSTVSVNGVVIVHDNTMSLHHVAVHAAAERVAKSLGRPVRAQAIDAEGRATLIVHPDGHATDVELVETYESEDEAIAVAAATPTPAPMFNNVAATETLPAGPPPTYAPAGAPGYAGAAAGQPPTAPPVAPRPPSGAPSGWPSKVVRMVAVAAALVAVTGMGVLLLGSRGDDKAVDRSTTETTEEPADPSPVAASATPEPARTAPAPAPTAATTAPPQVSVVALPGLNALRLTITSDTTPSTAKVTVTPAAGKVFRRTVKLNKSSTDVEFTKVPAGSVTWVVEVAGATQQSGDVSIEGPYTAPVPTPTPAAPVPAPVPAPAPEPTTPKPAKSAPKAPSEPKAKAKPKAKSKFKDKGAKGTTKGGKKKKRGPSAPIDPDDRASVSRAFVVLR